jgi:hypothetical protein
MQDFRGGQLAFLSRSAKILGAGENLYNGGTANPELDRTCRQCFGVAN